MQYKKDKRPKVHKIVHGRWVDTNAAPWYEQALEWKPKPSSTSPATLKRKAKSVSILFKSL